jgi:hypothetical protein
MGCVLRMEAGREGERVHLGQTAGPAVPLPPGDSSTAHSPVIALPLAHPTSPLSHTRHCTHQLTHTQTLAPGSAASRPR